MSNPLNDPNQNEDKFNKLIKRELDKELEPLTLDEKIRRRVQEQAKPSIWEREVRIPLTLAFLPLVLLIGIGLFMVWPEDSSMPAQSDYIVLDNSVFRVDRLLEEVER
ncbi:hypothetical protein [Paenibacillus eucommiae]|uniref:Uncharacterized protein n=1 Tax=Paenibacillus eucommiae TaxID=1355755 RepID=A0ABS4INL9_9BACL|nr:hypothetical protein [Paenibacillus eucommiae]MBP1989169.1 hypothetical protein [Paenibacillus eucommiae]